MSNNNDQQFSVRKILITVVLTAVVTSLITIWLPSLISSIYVRFTDNPVIIVEVRRGQNPLSDVSITLEDAQTSEVLASGQTNDRGVVTLAVDPRHKKQIFVSGSFREADVERRYEKTHQFVELPAILELRVDDFRSIQIQIVRAAEISPEVRIEYSESPLDSNRQVRAVLEIDWIAGTPRPDLKVSTTDGELTVEELLKEAGIETKVRWSDELPQDVMGPDQRFDNSELLQTMETYKGQVENNEWHFYIILGGQHQHEGILSLMFDTDFRQGGAVFDAGGQLQVSGMTLYAVLHSVGHMLNLPHPWQTYGDTFSVMTYSYRWGDQWSFKDPRVYRFDEVGREHVARSPEQYVRPGASPFLEYGETQPWVERIP